MRAHSSSSENFHFSTKLFFLILSEHRHHRTAVGRRLSVPKSSHDWRVISSCRNDFPFWSRWERQRWLSGGGGGENGRGNEWKLFLSLVSKKKRWRKERKIVLMTNGRLSRYPKVKFVKAQFGAGCVSARVCRPSSSWQTGPTVYRLITHTVDSTLSSECSRYACRAHRGIKKKKATRRWAQNTKHREQKKRKITIDNSQLSTLSSPAMNSLPIPIRRDQFRKSKAIKAWALGAVLAVFRAKNNPLTHGSPGRMDASFNSSKCA